MSAPLFEDGDDTVSLGELFAAIAARWKATIAVTIVCGVAGFGIASLIQPLYTARTLIIPQRAKETAAVSATNALSAIAGGDASALQSPADQYVSLMKSTTVADRIIDQFRLAGVYGEQDRSQLREALAKRVFINVGVADGMITVDVDDASPKRAADIANAYVDGLRFMTNRLALSEAQQRRRFFESQLGDAKAQLTHAQAALQATGFAAGALQASPGQVADRYAALQAKESAAEITLQGLRATFTPNAPAILKQEMLLAAMQSQLKGLERSSVGNKLDKNDDFIGKYREFKYRETLFDLLAQQFDAAQGDEAREGALIQVVDRAVPPEHKSKPNRSLVTLGAAVAGMLFSVLYAVSRAKA